MEYFVEMYDGGKCVCRKQFANDVTRDAWVWEHEEDALAGYRFAGGTSDDDEDVLLFEAVG